MTTVASSEVLRSPEAGEALQVEIGVAERQVKGDDAYLANESHGIAGVFDGVGGADAGGRAAKIAAEIIDYSLTQDLMTSMTAGGPAESLQVGAETVRSRFRTITHEEELAPTALQTTSTVVAYSLIDGRHVAGILHAGDSLAHMATWNGNHGQLVDEQVVTDDETAKSKLENALTANTNGSKDVIGTIEVGPEGARLILTTDGVHGNSSGQALTEAEWEHALAAESPQECADRLLAASKKTSDDGTVVVMDLKPAPIVDQAPQEPATSARTRLKSAQHAKPKKARIRNAAERIERTAERGLNWTLEAKGAATLGRLGRAALKSLNIRKPVTSKDELLAKSLNSLQEMAASHESDPERQRKLMEALADANLGMHRDELAETMAKYGSRAFRGKRALAEARSHYEAAVEAQLQVLARSFAEQGWSQNEIREYAVLMQIGSFDTSGKLMMNEDGKPKWVGEEQLLAHAINSFQLKRMGFKLQRRDKANSQRFGLPQSEDDSAEYRKLLNYREVEQAIEPKGVKGVAFKFQEFWVRRSKTTRILLTTGLGATFGAISLLSGGGMAIGLGLASARGGRFALTRYLKKGEKRTVADAQFEQTMKGLEARRAKLAKGEEVKNLVTNHTLNSYQEFSERQHRSNGRRIMATVAIAAVSATAAHFVEGAFSGSHHATASQTPETPPLSDQQLIQHMKDLQAQHQLADAATAHEIHTGGSHTTIYEAFNKAGIRFNHVTEMAQHAKHAGELREVQLGNGNFYYEAHTAGGWTDSTNAVAKALMKHAAKAGVDAADYRLAS